MKRRNFVDYSYFNKFLLNVCGVLPMKSGNYILSTILVFASIASSCFLYGPGFYSLLFNWDSIIPSERLDIVIDGNAFIICTIKVCILFTKREKFIDLMESCRKLWRYVQSDEDLVIIEKYAKRGLYLTYYFAGNIFIGTVFYLITPLFTNFIMDANGTVLTSKRLPFTAGIFHDNVNEFYIWYILQVPTAWISVVAIIAIDTAIPFCVLQACAHMRLCQEYFVKATNVITLDENLIINEIDSTVRKKNFVNHVVKSVSYHTEILQYSKVMEDTFESVILVQILASITAICGFCFGILVGDEKERAKVLTCTISVTVELLLLCWPPDSLQHESMKIANAAYDLPWYDWTPKEGKFICMIIAKSQKPVTLTARKFTIISLQTFTWVVKTAFSIVTLLQQVLE